MSNLQKPIRITAKMSEPKLIESMIHVGQTLAMKNQKVSKILGPYKDEETGDMLYLLNLIQFDELCPTPTSNLREGEDG